MLGWILPKRTQFVAGSKSELASAKRMRRPETASAVQLLGGLRNGAALIARACEFVLGGLTAAVGAGDRRGAIWRAAGHFIEFHLAAKSIVHADDDHAEMQEVGDDREQRGFLAAVLGRGRGEGAADFAVQRALGPETAGLIEKVGH